MALDERYIVASDLEQYFVDKDSGLPLANGTLTFYRDTARNVPKEVFQLTGSPPNYTYVSMGAQITLSAVGTVQNSGGDNEVIYYYPYDSAGNLDLYYVVCENEDEISQFVREAWPNITASNNPATDSFPVQNQISNPQFTNVFISEDIETVYTVSSAVDEVFSFAPNWDFVISGTGTVTVERIAIPGNDNIPTNPPYVIDINVSTGITECLLRQRFSNNSGLWASTDNQDIFLSGTFIARSETVGSVGVQMFYIESSGGLPILIVDASVTNSSFTVLTGSTQDPIPASNNTDVGENAYIDIYLSFTAGSEIRISSIQVVPTIGESINIVSYDQNSSRREEALQGDYYLPRLVRKRINSYLVGWDFPVNPFQLGSSGNIATTAAYITDQTIALRGSSGNVSFSRDGITNGLKFTTAGTNDAFYILQYLEGGQVQDMLGSRLSVNVFGYQSTGDAATLRVYLFRGSSSATIPTLPTSIGTVDSSGVFTLTASDWSAFDRSGLPTAQATLHQNSLNTDINDSANDLGFSGWEIIDSGDIADTDKFAIVVTISYSDASSVIKINSISVVPGDLPCRPSIKSSDETLRQCEYYYEKSYANEDPAGTSTTNNTLINNMQIPLSGGTLQLFGRPFDIILRTIKRISGNLSIYSPDGTTDSVLAIFKTGTGVDISTNSSFSTHFSVESTSVKSILIATTGGSLASTGGAINWNNQYGYIQYHYVLDSRLGII